MQRDGRWEPRPPLAQVTRERQALVWVQPPLAQPQWRRRGLRPPGLAQPVRHGRIEMINLIGDEAEDYARWAAMPGASVHLYGKASIRPGRKMGHVTRVLPGG